MKFRNITSVVLSVILLSLVSCSVEEQASYKMNEMKSDTYYMDVSVSYPVFDKFPSFTDTIKKDIATDLQYTLFVREKDWKELNSLLEDSSEGSPAKFSYEVTCEVSENAKYLSVLAHTWEYNGGAHGYNIMSSYTINKKTKKAPTLTELTGLSYEEISKICREELEKTLIPADNDSENTAFLKENIYSGTIPSPDYFSTFTVSGSKVIIHFEQYAVAPYVFGEQSVAIPLKK